MKYSIKSSLWPVNFFLGLNSVCAQILFLREFLAVFQGSEFTIGIIFANWLFWTAFGSYWAGKRLRKKEVPKIILVLMQLIIAALVPFTIFTIKLIRSVLQTSAGELFDISSIFLSSFIILSIFCFISGAIFPAASRSVRQFKEKREGVSGGIVYFYETWGAATGGFICSILFFMEIQSITLAIGLLILNLIVLAAMAFYNLSGRQKMLMLLLISFMFAACPFIILKLDKISTRKLWDTFDVKFNADSRYGRLTLIQVEEAFTLYENGVKIATVPDRESAEEAAHFALLAHAHPQKILLIGGGLGGALEEALKHPSIQKIDYCELDPMIPKILSFKTEHILKNPKINLHHSDGRLFLKESDNRYDLILLNLPDPANAQINRFYTVEFFREVSGRLNEGGMLSFQVSGSENYYSDEHARFLQCLNKTLSVVFRYTTTIPGGTVHFFAGDLLINAVHTDSLSARLERRNIETQYIRDYYVSSRFMPDRIDYLRETISPADDTPLNYDFIPGAYYFYATLWSSQFSTLMAAALQKASAITLKYIFIGIFFLLLIVLIYRKISEQNSYSRLSSGLAVIVMGYTMMALQIILLLSFQAVYGYVYLEMALLIGMFMAGMGIGSGLSLRRKSAGQKDLVLVHFFGIIIPLVFILLLKFYSADFQILFPLTGLVFGGLGGYQFPLVSRMFFERLGRSEQNTGLVYSLDLLGGLAGAALLSAFLIPLFGFFNNLFIVASLNLVTVISVVLCRLGTTRLLRKQKP